MGGMVNKHGEKWGSAGANRISDRASERQRRITYMAEGVECL